MLLRPGAKGVELSKGHWQRKCKQNNLKFVAAMGNLAG